MVSAEIRRLWASAFDVSPANWTIRRQDCSLIVYSPKTVTLHKCTVEQLAAVRNEAVQEKCKLHLLELLS